MSERKGPWYSGKWSLQFRVGDVKVVVSRNEGELHAKVLAPPDVPVTLISVDGRPARPKNRLRT